MTYTREDILNRLRPCSRPSLERIATTLYWRFCAETTLTLSEIGRIYGISGESVRRQQELGLTLLRHPKRYHHLHADGREHVGRRLWAAVFGERAA